MHFTEDEARAKEGRSVRLRDYSRTNDGIALGTLGTVVKAEPQWGTVTIGADGRKREGWRVAVQFDQHPDLFKFDKVEYERSLEELN
jgi:hypothetical protein